MNKFIFSIAGIFLLAISSCNFKSKEINASDADTIKSILIVDKLIKEHPNNQWLYNRRALLNLDAKDYPNALSDANKAYELDSTSEKIYITISEIYFNMGAIQRADEILNNALVLHPNNTILLLKKAHMDLYYKRYDMMNEKLDKCIELKGNIAEAYFIKAYGKKETKDTASAIKYFSMASEANPQFYDAFIQLGLIYSAKHQDVAIGFYEKALKIKPQSSEALYNLAYYYQTHNKPDEAIEKYKAILKFEATNKFANYNIGYIYCEILYQYNDAISWFEKAIEIDNNYAEAYYNKGLCYELLKKLNIAREDYKKALELKPGYKKAQDGLNRVK